MKIMGSYYRALFSSEGLLGKPACKDAMHTFWWADQDQRTVQSAKSLAEGMLPECAVDVHVAPQGKKDPMFSAPESAGGDPQLALAAVKGRIGPELNVLVEAHRAAFEQLALILKGNGKAAGSLFDEPVSLMAGKGGVSMDGPLELASTLAEDLLLEYTNGMQGDQLAWGRLNASNLQQIMELHTAYAELMRRTPVLAKRRGSNLLTHIVKSLQQAADGKPAEGAMGTPGDTVLVISGHDTNISNLSGMLGLSWQITSYQPDDAPPGGALVFSLWQLPASGYSVRVQFIAQTLDQMRYLAPLSSQDGPAVADLFVPGCSTSAKGYPCDWTKFLRVASEAVTP